jgi:hypothetical protein
MNTPPPAPQLPPLHDDISRASSSEPASLLAATETLAATLQRALAQHTLLNDQLRAHLADAELRAHGLSERLRLALDENNVVTYALRAGVARCAELAALTFSGERVNVARIHELEGELARADSQRAVLGERLRLAQRATDALTQLLREERREAAAHHESYEQLVAQVVALQAQLDALRAQPATGTAATCSASSERKEEHPPSRPQSLRASSAPSEAPPHA